MSLYEKGYYELFEHPNDPKAWAVELKRDEWKGIKYSYGKVQILEDDDGENATMKFEVVILDVPDYLKDKPFPADKQDRFYELAHNILVEELESYFTDKQKYDNLVADGIEPIKTEFDFNE
jgi:hypothetical protein